MKKTAVIGRGKTGQAVITALGKQDLGEIFSTENPVTTGRLRESAAVIVFIPADGFSKILPELLESKVPAVIGTTGFPFPADLDRQLKERKISWIIGSNFSPGMNFLFTVAKLAQKNLSFLGNPAIRIHEVHHVHKKDAPSGTALKLQNLIGVGEKTKITSERLGDHRGLHELSLETAAERLFFRHEALDRSAFGEGAVYAAKTLLPNCPPGLHTFETLMETKIKENL